MPGLESLTLHLLLVFMLVLARLGGLIATRPFLSSPEVPLRIRGLLTFLLALLLAPSQWQSQISPPGTLVDTLVLVGGEIMIGMILGVGLMILLSGVQLAGQIIGQMSGIALADVFNPGFDTEVPVFSQLLYLVTLAIFVTIGGHRKLLDALMSTLAVVPLGGGQMPSTIAETLATLLGESFALGVRAAAPAMTALLLATLVLGLISRTVPQLNILAVGFAINIVVTLAILAISIGATAWLFEEQLDPALDTLLQALRSP